MSAYEELVERCDALMPRSTRAILAEVLRTLETVTPEMWNAFHDEPYESAEAKMLAILRASPLTPNAADGMAKLERMKGIAPTGLTLPTVAELSAISANAGKGATRARLASWGVSWPPPGGWLKQLLEEARIREGEPDARLWRAMDWRDGEV